MISTVLVYLAVAAPQRVRTDPLSVYTKAVKSYYAINASPRRQQYRSNWLDVIDQFTLIYKKYPSSKYAPEALFNIGNLYNKLYTLSFLPSDLDHSIQAFDLLRQHYEKSKLADDALFKIAEIYRTEKGDVKTAIAYYERVLKDYPSSDSAPMAKVWVTKLGGTIAVKKIPVTPATCAFQGIRVWSAGDYTRIVISVSNDVVYSGHLLKQEVGDRAGKRVYVDLDGTELTCNTPPVMVKDGIVEEVRTGQFNSDTVRVVMDVGNIDDYSIFNLEDPFRIIVDVKGKSAHGQAGAGSHGGQEGQAITGTRGLAGPEPAGLTIAKIIQNYEGINQQAPSLPIPIHRVRGLSIRKVVIDPGHGGKDPGAIGPNGVMEKNITLRIGRMLAEKLRAMGLQVIMTRDSDTFIPLEERTAIANMSNADLFISIHANASRSRKTKGITTYYLSPTRDRASMLVAARENATSAKKLSDLQLILEDLMKTAKINESATFAADIQNSMVYDLRADRYGTPDLGVRSAPFFVLMHANMPSILVETSFITNPHEQKLLLEKNYDRAIVDGIVKGIVRYGSNVRMAEQ